MIDLIDEITVEILQGFYTSVQTKRRSKKQDEETRRMKQWKEREGERNREKWIFGRKKIFLYAFFYLILMQGRPWQMWRLISISFSCFPSLCMKFISRNAVIQTSIFFFNPLFHCFAVWCREFGWLTAFFSFFQISRLFEFIAIHSLAKIVRTGSQNNLQPRAKVTTCSLIIPFIYAVRFLLLLI